MLSSRGVSCVFIQLWLLGGFTVSSLPNVAHSGTAYQSSTFILGEAWRAIDGNRNPEPILGSCATTLIGLSHWWSVHLPAMYRVKSVVITNKNDLFYRMSDIKILIGNFQENNGNNNPLCATISSIPSGGTHTFHCGGMIGQLVNLKLSGLNPLAVLSVCEVEVYGEVAVPAPSFSAVVMGRKVAVVDRKLCWTDALFYCRDFHWDLLTVGSELEQSEVEEVLRTVSFNLTSHIWFGLRRYVMNSTWFWMSGTLDTYTHWEKKTVWRETSPCGAIDTSTPHRWEDITCGEHLNFICVKDFQHHKRVEFYSNSRRFVQLSP